MKPITDLAPFAVKNDGSEDFKTYVLEPLNKMLGSGFRGGKNWHYGLDKNKEPSFWATAYTPDVPILTVQQVKDFLLGEENMKEALSVQELKALCELFFKTGEKRGLQRNVSPGKLQDRGENVVPDFEYFFNETMAGKYNKMIEQEGVQKMWDEMMSEIDKSMEGFDREKKLKAHQAAEDLRKIILD